jgi:hypothetical protein
MLTEILSGIVLVILAVTLLIVVLALLGFAFTGLLIENRNVVSKAFGIFMGIWGSFLITGLCLITLHWTSIPTEVKAQWNGFTKGV